MVLWRFSWVALLMWFCGSSSSTRTTAAAMSTSASRAYDLVVIGGGSAGLTAAKFGATFGKSVVIVEKDKLGGDCTWTGCVPSKSLIASAKAAHYVRSANKYGIQTSSPPKVDMAAVRDRVQSNIKRIYDQDDSAQVLAKLGIDTLTGTAVFQSHDTLCVDESTMIQAKEGIVVATGAKPRRPTAQIPGLETIEYATYEEVFDLDVLPKKLTVVGGGPIGSELAQAFARLGSEVTQIAKRLVPKEEPEVSSALEQVFESEGITLVRGKLDKVEPSDGGHIATCTLVDGTSTKVTGDLMLVAVGRMPNVKGMGLERVGIQFNKKGGISVNDKLQTSAKNVYAAGDCTGDKQFTHYAGYQGAIAARNILLPLSDPGVIENVPATTFTSPEVASVGLSEEAAKRQYGDDTVVSFTQNLSENDRAVCDGEEDGLIKIICLKKNYKTLGATIMSPAAGEMISEISVAMKAKLPFDQLATVMHSYPAYSFALQVMAADVYYQNLVKSKPLYDFLKKLGL